MADGRRQTASALCPIVISLTKRLVKEKPDWGNIATRTSSENIKNSSSSSKNSGHKGKPDSLNNVLWTRIFCDYIVTYNYSTTL